MVDWQHLANFFYSCWCIDRRDDFSRKFLKMPFANDWQPLTLTAATRRALDLPDSATLRVMAVKHFAYAWLRVNFALKKGPPLPQHLASRTQVVQRNEMKPKII